MIGSKSIIYLPIRPSRRTIEEDELDLCLGRLARVNIEPLQLELIWELK